MKSIFGECKESAMKTVKVKINKAFAKDSFNKVSSGATFK